MDVPRIGLGTNRLRNTPEQIAFIRDAVDAGVAMIDTAHLYTGGESEAAIGAAFGGSTPIFIATKGGYGSARARPTCCVRRSTRAFASCGRDVIDLYYLHRVDPQTPLEQSLAVIGEYVDAGTIRHVGISEVTVAQIEQARAVIEIGYVQKHYNLGERKHDDVVDYCAAEGLTFVAFFPLKDRGDASPSEALEQLLRRSPAMLPIPGTLSLEHLRENLAAAG